MIAVLSMAGAGVVLAQPAGQGGGAADVWDLQSPRVKAAKEAYDQAAQKASDRYSAELSRLSKPLVYVLEAAIKQAERDGDQQEIAKLQRALKSAGEDMPVPLTTETLGWSAKFQGHSYLAILAPLRWNDALAVCRKLGGRLACIETREEMVFLQKLTSGVGVYVGATDVHREGDWRWVTGQPIDRDLWKLKEPDGGGGQNFAGLCEAGLYDVSDGDVQWGLKGFICEWDQ